MGNFERNLSPTLLGLRTRVARVPYIGRIVPRALELRQLHATSPLPQAPEQNNKPSITHASGAFGGLGIVHHLAEETLRAASHPAHRSAIDRFAFGFASERGVGRIEMMTALAFLGGTATAMGIASTLLPAGAVAMGGAAFGLAFANTFGIASRMMMNRSNPHSRFFKVWKFGAEKILPLALTADAVLLMKFTSRFDLEFTEIFSHFSRLKTLLPVGLTAASVFAYRYFKNTHASFVARMADPYPGTKWDARLTNFWVEGGIWAKTNYLTFRTIMFAAAIYGTAGLMIATPSAAVALAGGIGLSAGIRFARARFADHLQSPWIQRGVIGATTIGLALIDPVIFWSTLTTFTSGWALLGGDYHQGVNAIGALLSARKALNKPHIPPVPDQYMNRLIGPNGKHVMVVKPIVDSNEATIPVAIQLLINPYAATEIEVCHDRIPHLNPGTTRNIERGRQAMEWIQNELQGEFYGIVRERFLRFREQIATAERDGHPLSPGEVRTAYEELIGVLSEIFVRYFEEDTVEMADGRTVVPVLRRIQDKRNDKASKSWFPENDPDFARDLRNEIRMCAVDFFYSHALALQERVEQTPDTLTVREVEDWYQYLLARYSRRVNLIARKEDHYDDLKPSKSNNYAFTFTHAGDDMYQVWVYDKKTNDFYVEYVPALYVRVRNPNFDHTENSPRWIWVKRTELADELRFSQAGSEEIAFVDNTPDETDPHVHGVTLTIHGREVVAYVYTPPPPTADQTNRHPYDAVLPPRATPLVLRAGAAPRMADKVTWVAGEAKPADWDAHYEKFALERWGKSIDTADPEAVAKFHKESKWYKPEPAVLKVTKPDYYDMDDAEHINRDSQRRMTADIQRAAERSKYVRLFYYYPWEETLPNPFPNQPTSSIHELELVDAYLEIEVKTQDGYSYSFPYDVIRGVPGMVSGVSVGDYTVQWNQIERITAERDASTGTKHLRLHYRGTHKTVRLHQDFYPALLPEPEQISPDGLRINLFADKIGSRSFLMADYGETATDGSPLPPYKRYRFTHALKKRPWNFDSKMVREIVDEGDGKIRIKSSYQNPKVLPIDPRWMNLGKWDDREPRVRVLQAMGAAKDYTPPQAYWGTKTVNGKIQTAWAPSREELLAEGYANAEEVPSHLLGHVRVNKGGVTEDHVVPLTGLDPDPKRARKIIQIQEQKVDGEESTFEAVFNEGDYFYTLKPHIEIAGIPNLAWVENVEILSNGMILAHWRNPNNPAQAGMRELQGSDFVDNEGKELHQNRSRGMRNDSGYYQADTYTEADAEFRPELVTINNIVKLRLTRVSREKVKKVPPVLREILEQPGATLESFVYASMTSAVKLEDTKTGERKWVPLSLTRPFRLTHWVPNNDENSRWRNTQTNWRGEPLQYQPASIMHGNIAGENRLQDTRGGDPSARFDQRMFYATYRRSKFGNLKSPLDLIHYPTAARSRFLAYMEDRLAGGGGELQTGKSADVDENGVPKPSTVQNGTPYIRRWDTVEEVAELETSLIHRFKRKMVLYGKKLAASGVSEDDEERYHMQRLWGWHNIYVSEATSIAEEVEGPEKMALQRAQRWGTSMELRVDQGFDYLFQEIWHARMRDHYERHMDSGEMLNDVLFMTWYQVAVAELIRQLSPIMFLSTGGRLAPYPVDKPYFVVSVLVDVAFNLSNYMYTMYKTGYGPRWTALHGPARFIAFLGPYWALHQNCYKKEMQYGPFLVTSQTAGGIPKSTKRFLKYLMAGNTIALAAGTIGTVASGMVDFNLGVHAGNMPWAGYMLALEALGLRWLTDSEKSTIPFLFGNLHERSAPDVNNRPSTRAEAMESLRELLPAHMALRKSVMEVHRKDPRYKGVRDGFQDVMRSIDTTLLHHANYIASLGAPNDRYQAFAIYTYLEKNGSDHRMRMEAAEAKYHLGITDRHPMVSAVRAMNVELATATARGTIHPEAAIAATLLPTLLDAKLYGLPIELLRTSRRITARFMELATSQMTVERGTLNAQQENLSRLTQTVQTLEVMNKISKVGRHAMRHARARVREQMESILHSSSAEDPNFNETAALLYQAAYYTAEPEWVEGAVLEKMRANASFRGNIAQHELTGAVHSGEGFPQLAERGRSRLTQIQSELQMSYELYARSAKLTEARRTHAHQIHQLLGDAVEILRELESRATTAGELNAYIQNIYNPAITMISQFSEKTNAQNFKSRIRRPLAPHIQNLTNTARRIASRTLTGSECNPDQILGGWKRIVTKDYDEFIARIVELAVAPDVPGTLRAKKINLVQYALKNLHELDSTSQWRVAYEQLQRTFARLAAEEGARVETLADAPTHRARLIAETESFEGSLRVAIDNHFVHNRQNVADWSPSADRTTPREQRELHHVAFLWGNQIRAAVHARIPGSS